MWWCEVSLIHRSEKAKVLVAQLCPAVCDPMDFSLPGSSVHGTLQAGILEWVAIPFSGGSSHPRDWTYVFCTTDIFSTIWATREAHSSEIRVVQCQKATAELRKTQCLPLVYLKALFPFCFGVIWKGPLITRPCSIPTRSSAQPNTLAISALPNGMVLLQSQAHKCSSVQLKAKREFSILQSLFAFPFKWN